MSIGNKKILQTEVTEILEQPLPLVHPFRLKKVKKDNIAKERPEEKTTVLKNPSRKIEHGYFHLLMRLPIRCQKILPFNMFCLTSLYPLLGSALI